MDFENKVCKCGKEHINPVDKILAGSGVINELPHILKSYNIKKAFVLADVNTYKVAGEKVVELLNDSQISYSEYVFNDTLLHPDEKAVGSAVMHFDKSCDAVVAIGSGVINDIGKILASISDKLYIIVATAPSMDGYASATSSMSVDGLKVTLPSKCAEVIIGDTDVLKNAPKKMLCAGLGDMLAKYVSICEWRIGSIITGEYYCESIAELVRGAVKRCVDNVDGLLKREEEAVRSVFEGLIIGGVAMAYAGCSRPASGVEHYLSHIWDMRGLEKGTSVDLHGIQCAIGTLIAVRLYEQIKKITPDKEKALKFTEDFSFDKWGRELKEFMGKGADAMLMQEKTEKKYDTKLHKERLETIIKNWDKIQGIINEELISSSEVESLLDKIGAPKTPSEIGIDNEIIPMTFKASKDIRYKYVLSHLAWDLGILEEMRYGE